MPDGQKRSGIYEPDSVPLSERAETVRLRVSEFYRYIFAVDLFYRKMHAVNVQTVVSRAHEKVVGYFRFSPATAYLHKICYRRHFLAAVRIGRENAVFDAHVFASLKNARQSVIESLFYAFERDIDAIRSEYPLVFSSDVEQIIFVSFLTQRRENVSCPEQTIPLFFYRERASERMRSPEKHALVFRRYLAYPVRGQPAVRNRRSEAFAFEIIFSVFFCINAFVVRSEIHVSQAFFHDFKRVHIGIFSPENDVLYGQSSAIAGGKIGHLTFCYKDGFIAFEREIFNTVKEQSHPVFMRRFPVFPLIVSDRIGYVQKGFGNVVGVEKIFSLF